MKTLVVYDSNYGNTKLVADTIANQFDQSAKAVSINYFKEADLNGVELLVVGSPIIAWRPTERTIDFLTKLGTGRLQGIKAAAFDTRIKSIISGNAAKKIARMLKNAGAQIVSEPLGFYVNGKEGPLFEGEIQKATGWAKTLIDGIDKK